MSVKIPQTKSERMFPDDAITAALAWMDKADHVVRHANCPQCRGSGKVCQFCHARAKQSVDCWLCCGSGIITPVRDCPGKES